MKTVALLKKDFHLTPRGGLEKASARILQALKGHGAEVTLLTATPTSQPDALSCSLQSKLNFRRLQEFDAWCKKTTQAHSYDVVFSMDRSSHQTHHRAGNGVHAAYLELRRQREGFFKGVSFSLNPLHRVVLKLEKATFEDPCLQAVIVNSSFVKNQILQFYSTPSEKIHVIHNGVEWHEMETDFNASFSQKKSLLQSFGLPMNKFHFLFMGHNFHRKGLSPLLQALSQLQRSDFHLSVVGTDKSLADYKNQTADLSLSNQVTFFGAQTDTRPFYQMADALVIPSLYDPFANVTVEALAMGLFVISSKTNGGCEVLNPTSGITIDDPFEINRFAAALEAALTRPKTVSTARSIRATVQHLDFSLQLEKVCQLCLT